MAPRTRRLITQPNDNIGAPDDDTETITPFFLALAAGVTLRPASQTVFELVSVHGAQRRGALLRSWVWLSLQIGYVRAH